MKGQPGIVGTFHHQHLTAASNSFRLLKVRPLVLHIISFDPAPASISLHVAEVSNQKAEVQVISVLAAKPNKGFQHLLNQIDNEASSNKQNTYTWICTCVACCCSEREY